MYSIQRIISVAAAIMMITVRSLSQYKNIIKTTVKSSVCFLYGIFNFVSIALQRDKTIKILTGIKLGYNLWW